MSQAPVIGISGPARSGKDTVAAFIIAARGGYRYSFADPIRQMLAPLGVDMTDPYWIDHKEQVIPALGVSPRRLMQTLGTDWGREMINPDLWLLLALQRLYNLGPGMIIPDVRFNNEAEWVRAKGGRIVRLERKAVTPVEEHVSEAGIEPHHTDINISNNGTLEDLQAAVREIFDVRKT